MTRKEKQKLAIEKRLDAKKKSLQYHLQKLEKVFESAEKQKIVIDKSKYFSSLNLTQDIAQKIDESTSTVIPLEERVDNSVPKIEKIDGKRVDIVPEFPVYYEELLVPESSPEYIQRGNEMEIVNRIADRHNPMNL